MADGAAAATETVEAGGDGTTRETPVAAVAFAAAERLAGDAAGRPVLLVAATERRAARLADALPALLPGRDVVHLPRWDCLPEEPVQPAREVTGRRVALLASLDERPGVVVVASPDALAIRAAPAEVLRAARRSFAPGGPIDAEEIRRWFLRTGWILDERVDEPGEAAVRGRVLDVFPAVGTPMRIEHADGVVTEIHGFDPVTQWTTEPLAAVTLLPVSEAVGPDDGTERPADADHRVCAMHGGCRTLFDVLDPARLLIEPGAADRFETLFADAPEPPRYPELRLSPEDWRTVATGPAAETLDVAARPAPAFSATRAPGTALRRLAEATIAGGGRVVVAAAAARTVAAFRRALGREGTALADAAALAALPPGSIARLPVDLDGGFETDGLLVVAAPDLLGRAARTRPAGVRRPPAIFAGAEAPATGDTVIHRDHGLARLAGLETVAGAAGETEMIRLEFAGEAHRLVPLREIGRIFRYGADADSVTLDRADGRSWSKRREKAEAEIARLAEGFVAAARRRAETAAPKIRPPRAAFARFSQRFPHPESEDQAAAIDDVLADLASGRPMDRLVCGDVGYGKTEVALRAAAAVALCGGQVAVVAPTTVLARQHEETLRRRFAGLGVTVAALSRLVTPAEARRVKAGLADGSVDVVVGTHAVAGKGVAFADLRLVVIDEEQRFGAADKAKLRVLGAGRHVLSLSATPIPRTLASAVSGLQDVSVIATPPIARRPIRTVVMEEDEPTFRDALLREKRRGGQSFVVAPRIEDLGPTAERLASLVPDLSVVTVHGRLPAEEIDRRLLAFGRGDGDVLLATTIVESGLDMPAVNTMIVLHADRFGLAELHQLRGRVGRGRRRGTVHLTTPAGAEITPAATRRLATLAAFDRLGAGFEIAARDLELRGGGDVLGEAQAGHLRLVGAGLHRHLLDAALAVARGEAPPAEPPVVEIGQPGRIPEALVPEADVRLELYRRLATLAAPEEADAFAAEFADRFGDPGAALSGLIAAARIAAAGRRIGLVRVDAGPAGIALAFADAETAAAAAGRLGAEAKDERVVVSGAFEDFDQRAAAAEDLILRLAEEGGPVPARRP